MKTIKAKSYIISKTLFKDLIEASSVCMSIMEYIIDTIKEEDYQEFELDINNMVDIIEVDKSTIYRNINQLITLGVISKINRKFRLNKELFIPENYENK